MDTADGVRRMIAVLAFWAATIVFVTNVAVLSEWIAPVELALAGEQPTEPAPDAAPSGPTTITLDSGATVEFPQPPTRSEQILDVAGTEVTLVLHSAQGLDGATYNLGAIEYPAQVNLADPAANLIASASGAANNVGGRLLEDEVTVYQGAAAIEFSVEANDVRLAARHVLHGRRLYAQNVAYRGDEPPPAADAFFESFTLPAMGPSPSGTPATEPSDTFVPTPLPSPS